MADSWKDISGPVTLLVTFTAKEDRAEAIAQSLSKGFTEQVKDAKEGRSPGYECVDCTRYENKFAIWERYSDADAVERMLPGNFARHREYADDLVEPATFLFYPTDGLGVPRYDAVTNK